MLHALVRDDLGVPSMTPHEFRATWEHFKKVVQPGDVLNGRAWKRSSGWWLVDVGAPFLANLDDIDSDPAVELTEGESVEVVVRSHHDTKMMPFVTSKSDVLADSTRRVELPKELRGDVVWPPPVGHGGDRS